MTGIDAVVLADELVSQLQSEAGTDRAVNEKRYLKSPPEMRHIGVKVPVIRKHVKVFSRSHREWNHDDMLAVARESWSRQVHETRMAAIELLTDRSDLLTQVDAGVIEAMIDDSHTWAYVDNLAATTMGGLLERFPELESKLEAWSEHPNFWLRRSAMLALLGPIRGGGGDFERFGRYADSMLH